MAIQMQTEARSVAQRNGSTGNVPGSSDAILPFYATITPGLRALIVVTVMAATIMEFLDTSIVNVAMPHMMGNLGATLDEIGWVSTGPCGTERGGQRYWGRHKEGFWPHSWIGCAASGKTLAPGTNACASVS